MSERESPHEEHVTFVGREGETHGIKGNNRVILTGDEEKGKTVDGADLWTR